MDLVELLPGDGFREGLFPGIGLGLGSGGHWLSLGLLVLGRAGRVLFLEVGVAAALLLQRVLEEIREGKPRE